MRIRQRSTLFSTVRILAGGPQAFTLVEMLVVMAVISILLALITPVVVSIGSANTFSKTIADISNALEQARTYAMSHNTYVFVGLEEVDVTVDTAQKQKAGVGRVAISVVASKDGTSIYRSNNTGPSWLAGYGTGTDLVVLNKLSYSDNVHLVDLGLPPANGASMGTRQPVDGAYRLSNPEPVADSVTPFTYPLGANLGHGKYNFVRVVTFDPQGSARIVNAAGDNVVPALEIGLQTTRGILFSQVDSTELSGNIAAIQVDGITGAVRVFRP